MSIQAGRQEQASRAGAENTWELPSCVFVVLADGEEMKTKNPASPKKL
jgi:hypothetical protein